jgi:cobalt-zinc-cadmium efflux system membrane fusion protein
MSTTMHRDQVAPAHTALGSPPGKTGYWNWLRKAAPTAIVLSALAGLALWGHSTDWTLPKFSSLIGSGVTEVEDWCKEHNVPEAADIECNPKLLPRMKDYGWCKVHGVAQCPFEHPDVAQLKTPPSITPEALDRAQRALALKPRPENNSRCALHQKRIQFASTEAVEKAGIDIAVVQERPLVEAIVANGEVIYDQNRMARLSSRVAGTVWRVEKQVGDRVRKGDVLAIIDAADVGRGKSEFLQAIAQLRLQKANVERMRPLAGEGSIAGKVLREAETAYEEARIRLQSAQQTLINLGLVVRAEDYADIDTDEIARQIRFLGLPADLVSTLDPTSTTSNLFPLRTSLDGLVVERQVVEGEVVDTSRVLFNVADFSRLWLTIDVRQEDAKYLSLGQTALFRPSDSKNEPEVQGKIGWISTSADEQTRTVKVRVDLPNSDGKLRANTFGTGRIVLREEPKAIVVPKEAIHWDGTCNVVFVRDKNYLQPAAPKFFHVRSVRLGVKEGDTTEIIAGLLPGEVIASKNSVVLESQLLKSNLGAGCGCADGH